MTTNGMQPGRNTESTAIGGGIPAGPEALEVIQSINGQEIERQLIELARIGGERIEPIPEQPERYAANRLALSAEDEQARQEFVIPALVSAGAEVYDEHPLGVLGTIQGSDPDLAPVLMMSHTDSVRRGGMYDGTLGSLAAIEIVKAIKASGIQLRRSVGALIVTGEESAPFNIALFGSKGLFSKLNDDDLAMRNDGGVSIREALGEEAAEAAKVPLFGPDGIFPLPAAVAELHVEQGKRLEKTSPDGGYEADIGVVHSIASPERYIATVGDTPLEPDEREYPHAKYIKLVIDGKSDHSGATPMEPSERADGFVAAASYLEQALRNSGNTLSIGDIGAKGQGMSSIPGETTALLRLAGDSAEEINAVIEGLNRLAEQENARINKEENNFDGNPIRLEEIERPDSAVFFDPEQIRPRQETAFGLIRAVNQAALANREHDVVGTVGAYEMTNDGKIRLKVDVRGINEAKRADTVAKIHQDAELLSSIAKVSMGDILPGSGHSPVILDEGLVEAALEAIDQYEIARAVRMFSAAGHDTQNAALAGVRSVMLFCRSRGGISHDPLEYTAPEDLEMGARSMAALVLKLAA